MNIRTVLATLFFVLSVISAAVAGEPYAPKVKAPAGLKPFSAEDFAVMMVNAAVVPEMSAVNVPPYPGARVLQTVTGFSMTIKGKKVTCFPTIKLLSVDRAEKIVAFYKERLKGYRYSSMLGGDFNFFWVGGKDYNVLDINQACVTPRISISPADSKIMPEAKTEIELNYRPKK